MDTLSLPESHEPELPEKAETGIDRKWWVLVAVGVGTFMTALDTSVVNTILPVVNKSFGSAGNVAAIEWVVIVYLLVLSGLLLSFGRLGDLRGHRPVYLAGFFVFVGSSVLCGLAPTPLFLVSLRAVQALGAAMLSANSPAILTKSFPASQRGRALGLQATMTYLGLTVGPTLGGWLADQYSWRAVFFINLPVGVIALALSLWAVPYDSFAHLTERFDWAGALLFSAGLVTLLLGLNQGSTWGWSSLPILTLLLSAAGFLTWFVRNELQTASPMLDLSLFTRRLFTTSTVSAVLNYICVYSILFLMPFYLIQGRQFSASQAGLLLSAMPVVMAVVAPLSGTLSDWVGSRLPSTLGMAFLAAGLFLLAQLGPQAPLASVALALGVAGFGIGIFVSPNTSALLGAAPRHRQGIASGILATARNVGMVLGVGLAGAVFTTVLAQHAAADPAGLFDAIRLSLLAAAGFAILGIAFTGVRGNPSSGV